MAGLPATGVSAPGTQRPGADRAQHGVHVPDRLAADQPFLPGPQVPVEVLSVRRPGWGTFVVPEDQLPK
jgi:hypothetical protein